MKREKTVIENNNVWLTSDLHINHNKEFIYKARGFNSIEEMNEAIVENWNSVVGKDDIVYCLGDVSMGETKKNNSLKLINQLNGHIILIIGNHDTDNRLDLYRECRNIESIEYAFRFRKGKRTYWLSHYPTITANSGKEKPVWCLSGHTHSKEKFDDNYYYNYNVGLDAHDMFPVSFSQVEKDIKEYMKNMAEANEDLLKPYLDMGEMLKTTLKELENMK